MVAHVRPRGHVSSMPRRQAERQSDRAVSEETSVPAPHSQGDPGTEWPLSAAMQTRSGRRIRGPGSLSDTRPASRALKKDVPGLPDVQRHGRPATATEPQRDCPLERDVASEPRARKPESDTGASRSRAPEGEPLGRGSAGEEEEEEEEEEDVRVETCSVRKTGGGAQPRVKPGPSTPLGKPKSGRVWKNRGRQRFSALLRDKPLCSSWEKKMEAKREKELVKKYARQLKEEKAREQEEKRKRREENLRRREENERKAEIVQVIRNPAKMKRMKKKQLRRIEKRDTLSLLQRSVPRNQNVVEKGVRGSQ